jgi:DNA-binding transcriptional ArsR family regulator
MVKYTEAQLDRTFAALADPTRRAMLARLSLGELSVSELAEPFDMTLPAVMKHLTVLSDAGLVAREKSGRTVSCALQAKPMEDAVKWLTRYQRFWSGTLDRLAAFVEEEACPPNSTPGQVSSSAATSRRRRRPSSPPGRTRKR